MYCTLKRAQFRMHLFVLILLYCVAMVMAVPGCLSDRDKYHRSRRNCSGADFSEVPAGLEPTTEVLLFPSNTFSSLSWSAFTVFTNLYEIDLTSNKIPEVTPSAIPILPSLRVLRLGRNHLTTLSDGSFSACPALAELYLHDNAIRSLSDNSFSGLSKLEILDLSSNHIQVLPELMLHPLTTIETLYLENNKIRVMPDNWFSKREEVPYLYLSSNPWACSCSLGYLHRYLGDHEFNVYVREDPIIRGDVESVVCDSPHRLQGQPVINLEESDLCSSQPDYGPRGDNEPVVTTTIPTAPPTTTIPTTLPLSTTPSTPPPTTTSTTPKPMTLLAPATTTANPPVTPPDSRATTPLIIELTTDLPDSVTTTTLQSLVAKTSIPSTQVMILTQPTEIATPMTTSSVNNNVTDFKWQSKAATARAAGVFCFWLFAGNLLLCVMSAACSVMSVARLFVWYKTLKRRKAGGKERVRLITYTRRKEKEGGGGGEGVPALYRSVLFISKDAGEGVERGDGDEGSKRGEVGRERDSLEFKGEEEGGAVMRQERVGREEGRVYKKTLYRLISKQEEIEGWREMMEECQFSVKQPRKDDLFFEPTHFSNDATSSPPSCAEGWSTYKNHCFYYVEDKKPWVEAEMNCQKHKGNLASVHSQEELDFVHTLIPDNSTGMSMWVGGSNCQQEDTWLWKDGSVFNFTYWCPTEPNNMFGSQNCLQAALGDMKCWNDLQCDELLPSVCRSNL